MDPFSSASPQSSPFTPRFNNEIQQQEAPVVFKEGAASHLNRYIAWKQKSTSEIQLIEQLNAQPSVRPWFFNPQLVIQLFHSCIGLAYSTYRLKPFFLNEKGLEQCQEQINSCIAVAEEITRIMAHSLPTEYFSAYEVLNQITFWMRDVTLAQSSPNGIASGLLALRHLIDNWRRQLTPGQTIEERHGHASVFMLTLIKGRARELPERLEGEAMEIAEKVDQSWHRLDELFLSTLSSSTQQLAYRFAIIQVWQQIRRVKHIKRSLYASWKASLLLQTSQEKRECFFSHLKALSRDIFSSQQLIAYKDKMIPRLEMLNYMTKEEIEVIFNQVADEHKGEQEVTQQDSTEDTQQGNSPLSLYREKTLQIKERIEKCLLEVPLPYQSLGNGVYGKEECDEQRRKSLTLVQDHLLQASLLNHSLKRINSYKYYLYEIEIARKGGDMWHPSYLRKLKRLIQARKALRKNKIRLAVDNGQQLEITNKKYQRSKQREAFLVIEHLAERMRLITAATSEPEEQEQAARALLYELVE